MLSSPFVTLYEINLLLTLLRYYVTMYTIIRVKQITMKKKRIKHDYIDNRTFYLAMEDFYNQTQQALLNNIPEDQLPLPSDYIGECIFKISLNISYRPNFSGYTYRDDMVDDGVEDCLRRIRNFNPVNAKKNAFGYFSKIVWFAFLRRIAKEKKQQYIKYKLAIDSITNHRLADFMEQDDALKAAMIMPKDISRMTTFIAEYEEKINEKKTILVTKENKKRGLDFLMESDDE